jgi:hypothetical protein
MFNQQVDRQVEQFEETRPHHQGCTGLRRISQGGLVI